MSRKSKRGRRQKVSRMGIHELESIIRINSPRIRQMASLVAMAQRELKRRGHAYDPDAPRSANPAQHMRPDCDGDSST